MSKGSQTSFMALTLPASSTASAPMSLHFAGFPFVLSRLPFKLLLVIRFLFFMARLLSLKVGKSPESSQCPFAVLRPCFIQASAHRMQALQVLSILVGVVRVPSLEGRRENSAHGWRSKGYGIHWLLGVGNEQDRAALMYWRCSRLLRRLGQAKVNRVGRMLRLWKMFTGHDTHVGCRNLMRLVALMEEEVSRREDGASKKIKILGYPRIFPNDMHIAPKAIGTYPFKLSKRVNQQVVHVCKPDIHVVAIGLITRPLGDLTQLLHHPRALQNKLF
mmetsp:Transcript_14931/g.23255  ORF Transcript_14931/g.23255 Transcript_14931/m.23255 type:complete len:275 (+) Transcript_14931:337-1161(+)